MKVGGGAHPILHILSLGLPPLYTASPCPPYFISVLAAPMTWRVAGLLSSGTKMDAGFLSPPPPLPPNLRYQF